MTKPCARAVPLSKPGAVKPIAGHAVDIVQAKKVMAEWHDRRAGALDCVTATRMAALGHLRRIPAQ